MDQISIPAKIVNGHLQHAANLGMWEGRKVIVTLVLVPKEAPNGEEAKELPEQQSETEFDPELPVWLDVERSVYVPMTVPTVSRGKVKLIVERGRPSPFIPDD